MTEIQNRLKHLNLEFWNLFGNSDLVLLILNFVKDANLNKSH